MQDKKKCEEVNKRSFYEKLAKIPAIGIIFALFNSFLAPTCALIVKLVVEIHPIEHNIFRSLFQLIVYTLVILYYKYPIFGEKEERWFLLARCICGFLGSTFGFMSLRYLPLGDSAAIGLSTPIVVTIFARIFLKEPIGMAQVFALLATVVGGFLICRPTFIFGANGNSDFDETRRLTGTLLSFLAVISTAFVFITLRKLRKTSAAVVVFWLSLFYVLTGTTILTLIGSLKLPASIQSYILLFLLGLSGSLAQLCLTLATKLEKAGPISLANTAKVVFAFIFQVVLLHEPIELTSLVGSSIVFISIAFTGVHKWYVQEENSFQKQLFWKKNKLESKNNLRDNTKTVTAL